MTSGGSPPSVPDAFRPPRRAVMHAPLIVFAVVYTLTCLIGTLLMLSGYRQFIGLFEYFSGTRVPTLTTSQLILDLVLLLIAPLYLWLGYALGLRIRANSIPWAPRLKSRLRDLRLEAPTWFPVAVFVVLAAIAFASIIRAGSASNLSSWFDYKAWVNAREQTFRGMQFFEFVNIYWLLPLSAAWVAISVHGKGIWRFVMRWLPLAVTLTSNVLLFQKKQAVISLLIVVFAWAMVYGRRNPRRLFMGGVAAATAALVMYFAAAVVPIYSQASGTVCGVQGISCSSAVAKVPAVVLYAVLSPLTRTSAPALYYPIIFPRVHPFYPPDIGLDALGIGRFPDDNLVVWHYLNPHTTVGTTVVPFQFTLYSEGGVITALVGSLVVGFALALAWRLTLSRLLPVAWSGLVGSVVLVFTLIISIDSLRNGTIVSYGAAWGLLFVVAMGAVVHLANVHASRLGFARRRKLRVRDGERIVGA